MAAQTFAKPPESLSLEDISQREENWKQFKRDWTFYEVAEEAGSLMKKRSLLMQSKTLAINL